MTPWPVLMYHALWPGENDPRATRRIWDADPQLRDPGARLYAFDVRVFETHLAAMARAGVQTPASWSELLTLPERSPHALCLTFDDGHASNHDLALPLLLRYGLTAIFFITTDWIGRPGFMDAGQLRRLRQAGMLLGTHGCSHRYFSDLSPDELGDELTRSKAVLETILGETVPALALPGGSATPRVRRLAAEVGYRHLFTSRVGLAQPGQDPLDWPRIALTQRQPPELMTDLLAANFTRIEAMARRARLRAAVRRLLGHRLYDRVRARVVGRWDG